MPTALARAPLPTTDPAAGRFRKIRAVLALDVFLRLRLHAGGGDRLDRRGLLRPDGRAQAGLERLPRRSAKPSANRSRSPSAKVSAATNSSARSRPNCTSRRPFNSCRRAAKRRSCRRCRTSGCPASDRRQPGSSTPPDWRTSARLRARRPSCWGCWSAVRRRSCAISLGASTTGPSFPSANRPNPTASRRPSRGHHRRGVPGGDAAADGRQAHGQGARGRQEHPHPDGQGPLQ